MHDSLEEALQVLDDLRSAVDSNEARPSAEQICVELTHAMVLIGEYRQSLLPPPIDERYQQTPEEAEAYGSHVPSDRQLLDEADPGEPAAVAATAPAVEDDEP